MEVPLLNALAGFDLVATVTVPLGGGLENDVWRVTTEVGAFAARRHAAEGNVWTRVCSELAWLNHLAAREGMVAPRPLRRGDGALAPWIETSADGGVVALWSMLAWIEGEPLGRLPTAAEARATGSMIAVMHEHARQWLPPVGFTRPGYDASMFRGAMTELLARAGNSLSVENTTAIACSLTLACTVLDRLWSEERNIGVIHADLHDGNLVWRDGATHPAFIDFGRCGLGPLALDVAMAQHYMSPELAADLLDGYLEGSVASSLDQLALPALRYLAAVENLAVLSRFPNEVENVAAELPWLAGLARELALSEQGAGVHGAGDDPSAAPQSPP